MLNVLTFNNEIYNVSHDIKYGVFVCASLAQQEIFSFNIMCKADIKLIH